jgi:hypothetical protein
MPQDHRARREEFPIAAARRLRAEGHTIRAVADAIGWSFAHTRCKLVASAADGIERGQPTDVATGNGHLPAVSPTVYPSHPEHTQVTPVSPDISPGGVPDIARQRDVDDLKRRVEVLEAFIATLQQCHTPVSLNGIPGIPHLTDGTPPPTTKHSFVIAVDLLDTLQRYAAAHHLEIKAALDLALRTFFAQAGEGVHGHA